MPVDLIDTSVFVDVLRGHEPAAKFFDGLSVTGACGCPDVVLAELLAGCRNRTEIRSLRTFVDAHAALVFHDADESRMAIDLLLRFRPSHGVGYHDCLIAAMALRRGAIVHTLNLKHFKPIPGLKLERPYT